MILNCLVPAAKIINTTDVCAGPNNYANLTDVFKCFESIGSGASRRFAELTIDLFCYTFKTGQCLGGKFSVDILI